MKLKFNRIISIVTLVASVIAIVLVVKRPAPVSHRQDQAAIAQHAQSFDQKMAEFEQAAHPVSGSSATIANDPANPQAEVRLSSDEVSAVLAQSMGNAGGPALTPTSDVGSAAPTIKDQQVSFDGDVVHGQFLTQIAGKDVWITISGHIGEKDGYATFDPTEFKVGDLNVPLSMVNPALQKKLAEQRDRLKLPDNVGNVKVEHSQLVMQQK
jgi:hypothetical protein